MPASRKIIHSILIICFLSFIFSLHYVLPVYMQSSYLSQWIQSSKVGILYTAGSLLTILCFTFMAPILRKFGNFRVTLTLLFIEFLALLGLAYIPSAPFAFSFFIISFVSASLIFFTLDIFLEHFSDDSITGNIRGIYLTIGNVAWAIAPAIAAFILGDNDYSRLFLVSAALIIPVAFILKHYLGHFEDPPYRKVFFFDSIREVWKNRDIKNIFLCSFLLQFFYASMIVYTPIYLHEYMGFEWSAIGIMISIMLLAFVIMEAPLGRLADTRFGEKEILAGGFVVMAIFTGLIYFISVPNFILWATILFITRIGAAAVEVMTDTYFFKKVDDSSLSIISLYRVTRLIGYVAAPAVATIMLFFIDIRGLFFFLGLLMLYGTRYALSIKDTK